MDRPATRPLNFDDHAVTIAKRQYFQPGDEGLEGLFGRVASWVASPEEGEARAHYEGAFYDLMASKRFCPGGRVLAGANTSHGNVLNCFVQDGSPEEPGTDAWVLGLATKLALVTKVGGGNGLCLDPLKPKRPYTQEAGNLFVTVSSSHPDYAKVKSGTYMDLVHGKYVTKGYRYSSFVELEDVGEDVNVQEVGDSVESIWQGAGEMIQALLRGEDVVLDLSRLRSEGTPVKGSGGTSSGPSSFAVEVFDNFAYWASLGGAEYAGPIATLRYIFAPTLRVIRQGGCLHPDTLVHTSRGTLRLSELVDSYQYGWQDHALKVATDEGWKDSPRGFNNGNAQTLKVTLGNGQEIQGTPNHKLKVIRENGERQWVKLEDLREGDFVIQVLDQHTGASVTLSPVESSTLHHNAKRITTPETLGERLAFFLGYLWGDGFVSGDRVGFAVAHDSPMMEETPKLFRELFGLEVSLEQKKDDKSAIFVTKSVALVTWLKQNGLSKGKARDLTLPRAIRQAPRPIVGAFLRGLFEADGSVTVGYPTLASASKKLVQEVAVMLGGLGIPTTLRGVAARTDRYSKHPHYHVKVVSAKGHERFLERVGVMAGSRFEMLKTFQPDTAKESSWALPHARALLQGTFDALPAGVKGRPSTYTQARKTLSRYMRGERQLTATGFERLAQDTLIADKLPEFTFDEFYTPVKSVQTGGRLLTLDLSVDENKTYLANGTVSHNTRRGAGMATMSATHPDIQDFITCKDLAREEAEGDISTFNISVLVTDDFMERSRNRESGPLHDVAEHAWQTGEPGLIFIDRINEFNPVRESLGDIKATNPCVTGDTKILTCEGPKTFAELAEDERDVLVWAMDRRTSQPHVAMMHRPHCTFKNQEVLRVTFDSGLSARVTPDHGFFSSDGQRRIEARQLEPGLSVMAFEIARLSVPNETYTQKYDGNHIVTSVEPAGRADVYNGAVEHFSTYLMVDPEDKGSFTGVVSANCGEIPLFPGEPCDLGAINLAQYVGTPNQGTNGFDWTGFRQDVKTCIRFLDNVLEVNKFALEDNRTMSMKLRRLGLGVMGLADALIKMGLTYNSQAGRDAVREMITELRENATSASKELAEERGVFPGIEQSSVEEPRRNIALLTVAPTGTTSMLMGVSSGVEPIFAPFIYRKIGDSYAALISPLFKEMLEVHAPHPDYEQNGAWDWDKVVSKVQEQHGSVQGLDFIPQEVKDVLVCAHDISPEDHVKMQGTVQSAFDEGNEMVANSISKTINMPNEATVKEVYDAYSLAFETGCKGITVYRDGSRQFQVLSTKKEEKKAQPKPQSVKTQKPAASAANEARLPGEPLFDRPCRLVGFTDSVKLTTSSGERRSFYITLNKQDDLPTEVFIQSGKGGEEIMADSEALGRLASIALQYGVPAEAIVKTLRGINGGMYGTYQGRMVASKADLIAVALESAGVENELNKGLACPDCGAPLRFEEGCRKCESCGYSKCG